jgi:hypothetical protein
VSAGYRLVVPHPWVRVPVREDTRERVRVLVDHMARQAPKDMPPDQLGPMKREVEERLVRDIASAREHGGIDHYFPLGPMHGFHLGASFVVSEVSPPGIPAGEVDPASHASAVVAALAADDGQVVEIDGGPWVRTEVVVAPDTERAPDVDVPTRRVTYLGPVRDDPDRWVLVAFSTVGDGTPDGELTLLTVDLFDAIMGTWRWGALAAPASTAQEQ